MDFKSPAWAAQLSVCVCVLGVTSSSRGSGEGKNSLGVSVYRTMLSENTDSFTSS